MFFTALPCPPLPVRLAMSMMLKTTRADDEPETYQVCTSHDLLAGLLVSAIVRNNAELNKVRQAKQTAITKTLVDRCVAAKNNLDMYKVCKEFTAEYIHAFDDDGTCTPAVCFLKTEDVVKGDKVHKAICSWHAAQDIIFGAADQPKRKAEEFAKMNYEQLIQLHWLRVRDEPTPTTVIDEVV